MTYRAYAFLAGYMTKTASDVFSYVPADNTVDSVGILSPAESDASALQHYAGRAGSSGKDRILSYLEDTASGRSRAVNVLTEPIPEDANAAYTSGFSGDRSLYRISYDKLNKAGLVEAVLQAHKKLQVMTPDEFEKTLQDAEAVDWKKDPSNKTRIFGRIPHYMLVLKTGRVSPEYVDKVASDPAQAEKDLRQYLVDHPRATPGQVRRWAKDTGHDPKQADAAVGRLAGRLATFLQSGESGGKPVAVHSGAMADAIEDEREHTDDIEIRAKIGRDHLVQTKKYYELIKQHVEPHIEKQAVPTEAQRKAGNHKMQHRRVEGLDISIENPAGSYRRGVSPDGKPWQHLMQQHYGRIKGTVGRDGEHTDVFLKQGTLSSPVVYVVNQLKPNGKFDECKCMIGFDSEKSAKSAYMSNYEPGWKGFGSIVALPIKSFKTWVYSKAPSKGQVKEPTFA